MPSNYSKDWDKRDKRRPQPGNEPSRRFYDIIFSGGLGMFLGMMIGAWMVLR